MKFFQDNWIHLGALIAIVGPICAWLYAQRKIFAWAAEKLFPASDKITERALLVLGLRVSLLVAVAGVLSAIFGVAAAWLPTQGQPLAWSLQHVVWIVTYLIIFVGILRALGKMNE